MNRHVRVRDIDRAEPTGEQRTVIFERDAKRLHPRFRLPGEATS